MRPCHADNSLATAARFVEIEECAVHAGLVEVAAGHLDPPGISEAALFERLEAGGTDQPFDRRRSYLIVGGVKQHGPPRLTIRRACESVGAKRAEPRTRALALSARAELPASRTGTRRAARSSW